MRRLMFPIALLLVVGCRPAPSTAPPPVAPVTVAPVPAPIPQPKPAAVPAVAEHPFGEEVREGDLLVTVKEVANFGRIYWGSLSADFKTMMLVHLSLKNTSAGKIVEWNGRPDGFKVEDEHGNIFKEASISNHSWTDWEDRDGSYRYRINPGETHECAMYCQTSPPTSKQAKVTLPFGDHELTFHGPVGSKSTFDHDKALLDHDKALKDKAGTVLEADNLSKDLAAGSKTMDTDYPAGCVVRAAGVVETVAKHGGAAGPFTDNPAAAQAAAKEQKRSTILLKLQSGATVVFDADSGVFTKGERVIVLGTLRAVVNGTSPQIQLNRCVKAE
jgi:hypothetical protein